MIELLLALALMIQGPPAGLSVEGSVIRAGTNPPLALVNARLELVGAGQPRIARTDDIGRFTFIDLPPGVYTLSVTKDGYLRKDPGIKVDLRGNQAVKNLAFQLEPAPTIEGMIRDSEGNSVLNVTVQALRVTFDALGRRGLSSIASTRTDDRGMFRLYWLDPGNYFLHATGPPAQLGSNLSTTFAPTYYPGFVDIDDAKSIRLDVGRDATGMDFSLGRQVPGLLTGYVTSLSMGRGVATGIDVAPPSDGAGILRYSGQSGTSGAFTIRGVVPGTYIVSSTRGNETFATRVRVRNSAARGNELLVDLPIGPGVAVFGRFGNATQTPMDLRDARIQLTEIDSALPQPKAATIGSDGAFTIPAVQPGAYAVSVSGLPGDLYLKNATFLGADALVRPLSVGYGATPSKNDLLVEIGTDGGHMAGIVFDGNNAPFPGAQVVLLPERDSRFRLDRYRTALTDQAGRFLIRGIAPGDYLLFGWSKVEPNAHLDLEYMRPFESFGTSVHINPGENPAVGLRALQADR